MIVSSTTRAQESNVFEKFAKKNENAPFHLIKYAKKYRENWQSFWYSHWNNLQF